MVPRDQYKPIPVRWNPSDAVTIGRSIIQVSLVTLYGSRISRDASDPSKLAWFHIRVQKKSPREHVAPFIITTLNDYYYDASEHELRVPSGRPNRFRKSNYRHYDELMDNLNANLTLGDKVLISEAVARFMERIQQTQGHNLP